MIRYLLKHLRYLASHKWYAFRELWRAGHPWLAIVHDWTKLLPSEFIDYSRHYYGAEYTETAYQKAWNLHKRRNKHHWQYWVGEDGIPSEIPKIYLVEMVCDWTAAGKSKPDGIGTKAWYEKFGHKMVLHPKSRELLEELIYGDLSN